MIAYYLTHPDVLIDPSIPVPQWGLSPKGWQRTLSILGRPWLRTLERIVSSDELKARETAVIIGSSLGLAGEVSGRMGENDRSSTGYLEREAFERAADCFFAEPEKSWNGWERAVDASARIGAAIDRALERHDPRLPILFVGHGAVGTLLKCRLTGRKISRVEDQPGGGGNLFAFRLSSRALLCDWTPMEQFEGVFHAA